ncbi:polymorphic toxin type 50 domain-containing protein [Gordonia soli]|nr:polymorphic toxin type 50 domain-containing protein [Gordonia soli]
MIASLLAPLSTSGSASLPAEVVARSRLLAAQDTLAHAPARHYTGTVSTPKRRADIDITLSNEGDGSGTVKFPLGEFQYLSAAGTSLLKGSAVGWVGLGFDPKLASGFADRWTRITPDLLGIDLGTDLAPRRLAGRLDAGYLAGNGDVALGEPVDHGGVTAVPATSGGWKTLLVPNATPDTGGASTIPASTESDSDDEDPIDVEDLGPGPRGSDEVGHVEATDIGENDDTSIDLDVGAANRPDVYAPLPAMLGAASANPADSAVTLSANGNGVLAPCTASGCVLTYTLSNQVAAGSKVTITSVTAVVQVTMSVDGAQVANCTQQVTMAPNGTGPPVICSATYTVRPGNHQVLARVVSTVRLDAKVLREATETVTRNSKLPPDEIQRYIPNPAVSDRLSWQRQQRHLKDHPDWKKQPSRKGFVLSQEDAQKVLAAYRSGDARIIGLKSPRNEPVVEVPSVTGFDNNRREGRLDVPTHRFWIKGSKSPSVVPVSPDWPR